MNKKVLFLVFLLIIASLLIGRAVRQTSQLQEVTLICEQANNGAFAEAIQRSADWATYDYGKLPLVECRCLALLETNQKQACGELIGAAYMAQNEAEPPPERATLAFIESARHNEQTPLVLRLQQSYRGHLGIQKAAYAFFNRVGSAQADLLAIWQAHPSDNDDDLWIKLWVANTWVQSNQQHFYERIAKQVIETENTILKSQWYDLHLRASASAGNVSHFLSVIDAWLNDGGDRFEIKAKKALLVNAQKLPLKGYDSVVELETVVNELDRLQDVKLQKNIATRLMIHYSAGENEAARALYQRLPARLHVPAPEELAPQMRQQNNPPNQSTWRVLFRTGDLTKGTLWVSPAQEEKNIQAPYRRFDIGTQKEIEVETHYSSRPLRWIYKTNGDANRSGTLWPGDATVTLAEQPQNVPQPRKK